MTTVGFEPLRGFLKSARGRSQEEIIIAFLDVIIEADEVADEGSVLINHPVEKKLMVFNEGDFLFKKGHLNAKKRDEWPKEFGYFDGVAGRCFRERRTKTFSKADPRKQDRPDFFGTSPIQNMICIPILTGGAEPFGVVCFHNNVENKRFGQDRAEALEHCVDVLALALHTPHPELQLENNVFIVHGRDNESLLELQLILRENNVRPRVLINERKGPNAILESLEDLIRRCKGGFVLASPDDEGRLKGSADEFAARVRENVMFETGLLFARFRRTDRVVILLKKPLPLPSDLAGVNYESYTNIRDIEKKIVSYLQDWRLIS